MRVGAVARRWWMVGIVVMAMLYLGLSVRSIPERGEIVVLDSPFLKWSPRVLTAGWHLVPAGVLRAYRYPEDRVQLSLVLDEPHGHPLQTRDGSSVGVELEVSYRLLPDRVLELHTLLGYGFEQSWLRPRLTEAVRDEVGRNEFEEIVGANGYRLQRSLVDVFSEILARVGLSLERVTVWRVVPGELPAPLQRQQLRVNKTARVLFIGIDSADWSLMDPLMQRGELPNFSRLVEGGVRAKLRTISPTLSPVIWTTVATGKLPEKHGIVDFLAVDSRTGQQVPVTSNLRRTKAIWNILSETGGAVGVIAWWATWPPEAVQGYMVSDRLAYQLFGLGSTSETGRPDAMYPQELFQEVEALRVPPEEVTITDLNRFLNLPQEGLAGMEEDARSRVQEFRAILAATRTYDAVAHHLFRERPTPFQAIYYEGLDTASHLFMPFRPPQLEGVDQEDMRLFGGAVDEFYRYQDELLGNLLREFAGDDVNVIVASDHGFRHGSNRPLEDARIGGGKAAEWHRKYGILILHGPAFRQGVIEDTSVADITPTILALFGLPRADDMDGRVLEEAFLPGFLQRIPAGSLRTYEDPEGSKEQAEPIHSDADATIVSKLTALGYLSQAGSNSHNNRGVLLMNQGRYHEAVEEFLAALESNPQFLVARINMGRSYMFQGDSNEALEVFEEVLRRDPTSQEVENSVGNIYMERGDLARAEKHFLRAREIEPNDTHVLNSLGILYERQGRWEKSIALYRQVTEVDPDYGEGYNNLGNVMKQQGRLQEAEALYQQAMEADPTFVGSYNNLALIYQERGDLEGAIALYRKALEKAPDHPKVRLNLGSLYYQRGDYKEAVAEFQRALELDPNYPDAHNNLGAVFGQLGEFDRELEELESALALRPDYADARHNLGLAYLRAGQDERGIEQLRRAVKENPDYFSALVNLGAALSRRGRHEEGIPYLERSLELNPDLPQVRNTLAAAYLAAGERDKGIGEYQASLALEPEQPNIRQRLMQMGVLLD